MSSVGMLKKLITEPENTNVLSYQYSAQRGLPYESITSVVQFGSDLSGLQTVTVNLGGIEKEFIIKQISKAAYGSSPTGWTHIVGMMSKPFSALDKAPEKQHNFLSMTIREIQNYDTISYLADEDKTKIINHIQQCDSDYQGGWTINDVIKEMLSIIGFNDVIIGLLDPIYIRQAIFPSNKSVLEVIYSLINTFQPHIYFDNNILYILDTNHLMESSGYVTLAKGKTVVQSESYSSKPSKIVVKGGLAPFDYERYRGVFDPSTRYYSYAIPGVNQEMPYEWTWQGGLYNGQWYLVETAEETNTYVGMNSYVEQYFAVNPFGTPWFNFLTIKTEWKDTFPDGSGKTYDSPWRITYSINIYENADIYHEDARLSAQYTIVAGRYWEYDATTESNIISNWTDVLSYTQKNFNYNEDGELYREWGLTREYSYRMNDEHGELCIFPYQEIEQWDYLGAGDSTMLTTMAYTQQWTRISKYVHSVFTAMLGLDENGRLHSSCKTEYANGRIQEAKSIVRKIPVVVEYNNSSNNYLDTPALEFNLEDIIFSWDTADNILEYLKTIYLKHKINRTYNLPYEIFLDKGWTVNLPAINNFNDSLTIPAITNYRKATITDIEIDFPLIMGNKSPEVTTTVKVEALVNE